MNKIKVSYDDIIKNEYYYFDFEKLFDLFLENGLVDTNKDFKIILNCGHKYDMFINILIYNTSYNHITDYLLDEFYTENSTLDYCLNLINKYLFDNFEIFIPHYR